MTTQIFPTKNKQIAITSMDLISYGLCGEKDAIEAVQEGQRQGFLKELLDDDGRPLQEGIYRVLREPFQAYFERWAEGKSDADFEAIWALSMSKKESSGLASPKDANEDQSR